MTPFTAFCWQPPLKPQPHLSGMVRVAEGNEPLADIAAQLKALPPGKRVLCPQYGADIYTNPKDTIDGTHFGLWPVNGVASVQRRMRDLFASLKTAGATIDMVALDLEASFPWDRDSLTAILADQRFYSTTPYPFPYSVEQLLTYPAALTYWIYLTNTLHAKYLNEAVFKPLQESFPSALLGQYGSFVAPPSMAQPDEYGEMVSSPALVGNVQCPVLYGNVRLEQLSKRVPGPMWSDPYVNVAREVNKLRVCAKAGAPVVPWVKFRSNVNDGGASVPFGNSAWWDEMVRHALLYSRNVLFFNPHESGATEADENTMNLLLAVAELAKVNATSPTRTPINLDQPTWFATVTTGRDERHIARVTFHPSYTGRANVQVGKKAVHVSPVAGACGVWVVGK